MKNPGPTPQSERTPTKILKSRYCVPSFSVMRPSLRAVGGPCWLPPGNFFRRPPRSPQSPPPRGSCLRRAGRFPKASDKRPLNGRLAPLLLMCKLSPPKFPLALTCYLGHTFSIFLSYLGPPEILNMRNSKPGPILPSIISRAKRPRGGKPLHFWYVFLYFFWATFPTHQRFRCI